MTVVFDGGVKGFQLWVALPPELENAPHTSPYLPLSWQTPNRRTATEPAPGFHMVRYYGCLSSHSSLRKEVVPVPAAAVDDPPPRRKTFDECSLSSAKKTDTGRPMT